MKLSIDRSVAEEKEHTSEGHATLQKSKQHVTGNLFIFKLSLASNSTRSKTVSEEEGGDRRKSKGTNGWPLHIFESFYLQYK